MAGVTLGANGGVYVSSSSEISIQQVNGEYILDLDKGSVAFAFDPHVPFKVAAAGNVVSAATDQATKVTSDQARIVGAVTVDENGEIRVHSQNGVLQVVGGTGSVFLVRTNESFIVSGGEARLIETQVEDCETRGSIASLGNGPCGSLAFSLGDYTGSALFAALVAAGLIVIISDDDDDAPAGSPN